MTRPPRPPLAPPAGRPPLRRAAALSGRWAAAAVAARPAAAGLAVVVALLGAADPLSVVRDDTLGVRPEEGPAFEALLERVADEDPAALAAEAAAVSDGAGGRRWSWRTAATFPAFPDLFNNPAAYRGRAVTLVGQARKITEYPAGPAAAKTRTAPRVSVIFYTDDAQTNPAIVVAHAADGLPRGDDLLEPVKVTGRFFKRWGYEAADGKLRIAPMLLADRVEPVKAVQPPPATPFVLGLTVAVTVVGLSAGLWAWWLRPKRRRGTVRAGGGETPDLGGFAPPPDEDPEFPRA